jgi:cold shock CspA family protein
MAGPVEELVKRLERRVEQFREEHALAEVEVTIELMDGSLHRLRTLAAEPGFGFISFCPHGDEPEEVIVPLGAVREIRLRVPSPEQAVGFAVAETG